MKLLFGIKNKTKGVYGSIQKIEISQKQSRKLYKT